MRESQDSFKLQLFSSGDSGNKCSKWVFTCVLSNNKGRYYKWFFLNESQIQLSTSHSVAGKNKHKQIKSKTIGSGIWVYVIIICIMEWKYSQKLFKNQD